MRKEKRSIALSMAMLLASLSWGACKGSLGDTEPVEGPDGETDAQIAGDASARDGAAPRVDAAVDGSSPVVDASAPLEPDTSVPNADPQARIDSLWLAQTHVVEVRDPLLKLVGNRKALLKANVVSPNAGVSPTVRATLRVGNESTTLTLKGPATLPKQLASEPGVVVHRYEDSFTVQLPAEWVRPGLTIEVEAGQSVEKISPAVGAPTVVHLTMWDVYYFGRGVGGDYPSGWAEELEAKWPVADLRVQRVPKLLFDKLVIPPRGTVGAALVASPEEYKAKTGVAFDGEQGAALRWVSALCKAGGQSDLTLCFVNIHGANAGGQAGGFSGVGNGTGVGILNHELGHALSLPHWGGNAMYPYKGPMVGIAAPDTENGTHAGPAWAFDLPSGTFIPPTVQPGNVGDRAVGTFKADPMQGGGTGDQEPGFLMRHFSDYSVSRMQNYLEGKVVIYDSNRKQYVSWDSAANAYSKLRTSNGVNYPIERDVQVVSIMAATSMVEPTVNFVYAPIGPYASGLIRTFDPGVPADRTEAAKIYCPAAGCDYSLRVVQGSQTRTFMLRASGSMADDPLLDASFGTAAINLRASDGTITDVRLLATPDAQVAGVPANPTVLARWPAQSP